MWTIYVDEFKQVGAYLFIYYFRAPKSLTALNTCLDEMEEFKGRDRAFVSDWL